MSVRVIDKGKGQIFLYRRDMEIHLTEQLYKNDLQISRVLGPFVPATTKKGEI